ncbi:MAG TPA: 16S rRNA (cytidine(1402)-2'-O)-methyltransferase [Acidimicrobiales bacterium]|nr:16S rRNA (cytidine(1402)-2'-O)-methyltransferase [Acidimicrobiales bacterium]
MAARPGGRIVLVGTPIGNLGDLSPRAAAVLAEADLICCEDTRRTRQLLTACGVAAGGRLVAMHAHNERQAAQRAVDAAAAGQVVAVVTDAGMPGVSDPGEAVVQAAVGRGVEVDVVPGPAAAVTALVASGLPTARWAFEGFLPRSGADRARRLGALAVDDRTTVLYEAPHRVARTLADLAAACGAERPVAAARELTKLHQQLWRGTLGAAVAWVAAEAPRGEWVLVVGPAPPPPPAGPDEVVAALEQAAAAGVDRRAAVATVAAALGAPRREVYTASLALTWRRPGP